MKIQIDMAAHDGMTAALEHLAQWANAPNLTPATSFDDGYNAGRMYAAKHARTVLSQFEEEED